MKLVLIGGGARSGKSTLGLELAASLGERRVFVATAEALDDEMADRIARHRRERDASFRTVEAPLELARTLETLEDADVALVDCVTLWLSNLLCAGDPEPGRRVDDLVAVLRARRRAVVLVTNEVGMGLVPETALGRAFRDLAGVTNRKLAEAADEVYFAVMGLRLRLK